MSGADLNGSTNGATPINGLSFHAEIEGEKPSTQFRYHRDSFRFSLVIAAGLTLLVCSLLWLLLGIYGSRYMNWITLATGVVFFAFMSFGMVRQYFRNEVVLAVQPTGLYDGRVSSETIPWSEIKELVLLRREQEYTLRIIRWPRKQHPQSIYEVDLSVLEKGAEPVLTAIQDYMPVRVERF